MQPVINWTRSTAKSRPEATTAGSARVIGATDQNGQTLWRYLCTARRDHFDQTSGIALSGGYGGKGVGASNLAFIHDVFDSNETLDGSTAVHYYN
ncbi:hypothetical protein [Pseudomonas frederiksbergensis]|uniref:hypothetical protein n=1 Tax=Pseudomonas frederiksbergensis TaxID=104087 RepID=UPI003D221372